MHVYRILALFMCSFACLAADLTPQAAMKKGAEYLASLQNENGSYGKSPNPPPAISALAALGMHDCSDQVETAVTRSMVFALGYKQEDGSIYPAEWSKKSSANYPNYTTSIVLLAMATIDRPEYLPLMKAARAYLKSSQFNDPSKVDFGGIGYGKTGRADLSNGSWAAEALHYTEHLESPDGPEAKKTDQMWKEMAIFLTKCQNLPEFNKEEYVSSHEEDLGGFIYRPNESKAGSQDGEGAISNLISSGSMTYAGLKSMIYARLKKNDPRVKGAIDYLSRNWTLEENPGMGMQGLYYYLLTMAKALDAYGADTITDADGKVHDWRQEVTEKLLSMQREDGSWVNENGRFMESLPELSTSYALMTLKVTAKK